MKNFEKPEIEITIFGEDIITTSKGLKSGKDDKDDNYEGLVFE